MQSIVSQNYISKDDFIARFIKIPYAHKKLAEYIYDAGFKNFDDLKKSDPELIYSLICIRNKQNLDYNTLFDLKAIVAQME
ncbi:MAG: hypothetical protein QMC67_08980 [Candidatus Wallbacteria bacterium]